ncbi:MAG: hypothetical protein WCA20_14205 [Candidatus Sulfotelmatobacter sp.]
MKVYTCRLWFWSTSDHNRLITAATAAYDLAKAVKAGADTDALCREIEEQMDGMEEIISRRFEPVRKQLRKRSEAQGYAITWVRDEIAWAIRKVSL